MTREMPNNSKGQLYEYKIREEGGTSRCSFCALAAISRDEFKLVRTVSSKCSRSPDGAVRLLAMHTAAFVGVS